MKKIITILVLSAMFSCSNEKDNEINFSDNQAVKLIKTKDKSNFSKEQFKTIVDYLDKHPETIYNQTKIDSLKNSDINTNLSKSANMTSKIQMTAATPTMDELMAVQPGSSNGTDFNASANAEYYGAGRNNVKYRWTVAENVFGFFTVMSKESIIVSDNGLFIQSSRRYNVHSISHEASGLEGIFAMLTWKEDSNSNIPGQYGAYFFTGGHLSGPGMNKFFQSARYANMAAIIGSGGLYSGDF